VLAEQLGVVPAALLILAEVNPNQARVGCLAVAAQPQKRLGPHSLCDEEPEPASNTSFPSLTSGEEFLAATA
jgi:hypothetical protein